MKNKNLLDFFKKQSKNLKEDLNEDLSSSDLKLSSDANPRLKKNLVNTKDSFDNEDFLFLKNSTNEKDSINYKVNKNQSNKKSKKIENIKDSKNEDKPKENIKNVKIEKKPKENIKNVKIEDKFIENTKNVNGKDKFRKNTKNVNGKDKYKIDNKTIFDDTNVFFDSSLISETSFNDDIYNTSDSRFNTTCETSNITFNDTLKSSNDTFNDTANILEQNYETIKKQKHNKLDKDQRYPFLQNIRDDKLRPINHKDYDPSTLFIPDDLLNSLTPFEKQFWEIKKKHFDTIVFFKKGKFYELYENDATVGSKLFNMKITERVNMKMAGFPESSLDEYLNKFIENGYKITVVDQVKTIIDDQMTNSENQHIKNNNLKKPNLKNQENKKQFIIKREIKEIITEGTHYNTTGISNHIISFIEENNNVSFVLYDSSCSSLFYNTFLNDRNMENFKNLIIKFNIKEYICNKKFSSLFDSNVKFIDSNKFTGELEENDLLDVKDMTIIKNLNKEFVNEENLNKDFIHEQNSNLSKLNETEENLNVNKDFIHEQNLNSSKLNKTEQKCFIYLKSYFKYLHRNLENIKFEKIINKLYIDSSTIINMDLINSEKNLFDTINYCKTPFGERKLRNWLLYPLGDYKDILTRQNDVSTYDQINFDIFKSFGDLERVFSRLKSRNGKIKDLFNFVEKMEIVVKFFNYIIDSTEKSSKYVNKSDLINNGKGSYTVKNDFFNIEDENFNRLTNGKDENFNDENDNSNNELENYNGLSNNSLQVNINNNSFNDNINKNYFNDNINKNYVIDFINKNYSNKNVQNNNHIKQITYYITNINKFLNNFKSKYKLTQDLITTNSETDLDIKKKQILQKLDTILKNTQKSLKTPQISFKSINKEIYQLEIPKNIKVPDNYYLVSGTKTHNRYYTQEIKLLIQEFNNNEERIFQYQGQLFDKSIDDLIYYNNLFINVIDFLGYLDCIQSINIFNNTFQTCKPILSDKLQLEDFYNPIYPLHIKNNYNFNKLLIITGPNMGGKSTFMRSLTINIILFHMGFNTCCKSFKSPVFDSIFSRIGANDNLLKGESTFKVELSECSMILRKCTNKSFIIMDELGRGTSTKDGEKIARSVLKYLNNINCYVLFSTHYHKLVTSGIYDMGYMDSVIRGNNVIFLYKMVKGVCKDSNGIYVAKLAGVPESIINMAYAFKKMLIEKEDELNH